MAIQAMAVARAERAQNVGPRLGGPTINNQISTGKQVISKISSKHQTRGKQYFQIIQHATNRTVSNYKKLVRQKRPTIHRIGSTCYLATLLIAGNAPYYL